MSDGRVALVTGGGGGIGRTIALRLASEGRAGRVVVNDLVPERARDVAAEVTALGNGAEGRGIAADVTDWESMERLFDEIGGHGIDILVNNAGLPGDDPGGRPFTASQPAEWRKWIDINIYGVLHACRLAVPGMVERGWGRIITIGSAAARVGEAGLAVYSGAKAGSSGFMRALAKEVGASGITCNVVALGGMRHGADQHKIPDHVRERIIKGYAVPRLGENTDAAAAVSFLAGDEAAWITRQTIAVDGGYTSS